MDKTTEVHQTKKMLKAFKWIVFLLIIIVCMPPFSIRTENGSKKIHLISMILNPSSIPEIVTSLIKSVIEPRGKHKITKPNSKTYKEQAQLVRNSEIYGIDSNEDNSTDSQYNSKKLAQNKSKQQENNLETGSKKNSTESSNVTYNTTLNSAINNNKKEVKSVSNHKHIVKSTSPPPLESPVSKPSGIEIKIKKETPGIVSNWEKIEFLLGDNGYDWDGESNSNQYRLLNNMVYSVTANGDKLTLTQVWNFPPFGGYYYQKPYYQNESIICPAYKTYIFDHLAKIDLNNLNNITRYYLNTEVDNINFDKGQFFTINDAYYFLSYDSDSAGLYKLEESKEESKDNTTNVTIKVSSFSSLEYSPIENNSIVVLNDTLYYVGYNNFGCCRLCAVKISGSQDESQVQIENQVLIENIGLTNSFSLLETDNINRIWIINDINGVIEYNTENERSKKISNKNDSYPDIYSSDSAVSFYSNDYLYLIVNNQAYMLYVGAYTEEKLFDMGFREKAYTYPQGIYKVFEYSGSDPDLKDKDFILVDNLQIVLDEHNNNNEVFSFVTACNKDTQTIWKQEVLKIKSDLDQIGIISKDDFRTYYREIQSQNVDSFSVLITTDKYLFEDWKSFSDKKFSILYKYKEVEIAVPCLPFWCIDNLESNKIPEVQDASEWCKKYNNLATEEIAQFTYLNKNGCGITKKFRLMFIIPNE